MQRTWLATSSDQAPVLDEAAAMLGSPSPEIESATVVLTDLPLAQAVALAAGLRPEQVIIAVLTATELPQAWAHLGTDLDDVVGPTATAVEIVARVNLASAGRRHGPIRAVVRRFAHDLNNPLTAVRLLSEMLVSDIEDPVMKQDLTDILEAADVASALVDNLAGFVKADARAAPNPRHVDIVAILFEVAQRPFLREHVRTELPTAPVTVIGERAALRQAVLELAHTARQMSIPDGRATIRVERGTDHASLRAHVKSTRFEGADERLLHRFAGIREDLQRFQLLPTGLSASANTARRSGGELTVRALPDGLELCMHLPTPPLG